MFEGLLGNENVKNQLRRFVEKGRIPQSLLFCGIDGVGKKHFALELARSFVCTRTESGLPCGTCAACLRVGRFTIPGSGKKDDFEAVFFSEHPDVGLVIPNKNTIYVEAVRNLVGEANYRPFEARARVFIIDEAEKLSLTQKAAANALLKTLEEPAETTYIILVTSNPSSLPQTIHSRCQKIRFSGLKTDELEELLVRDSGVSTRDAKLLARISRGSVVAASSIDIDRYREKRDVFLELIDSAAREAETAGMLKISETISVIKEPGGYLGSLEILETLIRDIMLMLNGRARHTINQDVAGKLETLGAALDTRRLSTWISDIETLKSNLRFNINRKIGTDALFVRMAGG